MLRNRPTVRTWTRLCLAEGIAATPLVVLAAPGNFVLAALFVTWGFPTGVYGAVISIRSWCNLLQAGFSPIAARYWPSREYYLVTSAVNTAVWGLIGLMLSSGAMLDGVASIVIVLLIAAHLSGSMTGIAWTAWIHQWIPGSIHASFFAHRIRWTEISAVGFLFVAALVLRADVPDRAVFGQILVGAVGMRAIAWYFSYRIKGGRPVVQRDAPLLGRQYSIVWSDRRFLRFIVFSMAAGFAFSAFTPFLPLFMLQHLGLTAGDLGVCSALATLAGALVYPAWGRLAKRTGFRTMLCVAFGIEFVVSICWCIVSAESVWIAYAAWIVGGVAIAGVTLGKLGLLLKLVPAAATTTGIGVNAAVASIAAAAGPMLAGAWLASGGIEPTLVDYHHFLWVQPVVVAGTIALLLRISESAPVAMPMELSPEYESIPTAPRS